MEPSFVGVDWGTSSFRAYLVAGSGRMLKKVAAPAGILGVKDADFAGALEAACGAWLNRWPRLPVLMCGMIGSSRGWFEVPYLSGPVAARELAEGSRRVPGARRDIRIVPGISGRSFDASPDIMRGEETLLIGALGSSVTPNGLFCLPGTHCKWVRVEDGAIAEFSTFMTGELFALLSEHSILSGLIAENPDAAPAGQQPGTAFDDGVERAGSETGLLHQLFALRAGVLTGSLAKSVVGETLSGLLIGAELAGMRRVLSHNRAPITVISGSVLAQRYGRALGVLGYETLMLDADEVCLAGLYAIARDVGRTEPSGPYASLVALPPEPE